MKKVIMLCCILLSMGTSINAMSQKLMDQQDIKLNEPQPAKPKPEPEPAKPIVRPDAVQSAPKLERVKPATHKKPELPKKRY